MSSTTSGPRSDMDLASSCDESCNVTVPTTPVGITPVSPPYVHHSEPNSTPVTPSIGSVPCSGAFRFHKNKKVDTYYCNGYLSAVTSLGGCFMIEYLQLVNDILW